MAVSWKIVMPKGKQTKEGKGRLHLQILINRKKKIKSLNIQVFPREFVKNLQRVAIPDDKRKENLINAVLKKVLNKVESNFYKCVLDLSLIHI